MSPARKQHQTLDERARTQAVYDVYAFDRELSTWEGVIASLVATCVTEEYANLMSEALASKGKRAEIRERGQVSRVITTVTESDSSKMKLETNPEWLRNASWPNRPREEDNALVALGRRWRGVLLNRWTNRIRMQRP